MESLENVTKSRFDEINKIDFSAIPLGDAIVMGPKGPGTHSVLVFTDVD